MVRAFLLAVAALMTLTLPGAAQSIDELPTEVFEAARSLEQKCVEQGGSPDYEPLHLVKLVFFGADWDDGGRESYVIDTAQFRCSGVGAVQARPFCEQGQCRLIVMTPKGASGFAKGLDRLVSGWRLVGDNAASSGPNILLQTTETGSNLLYKEAGSGMERTGPSGD